MYAKTFDLQFLKLREFRSVSLGRCHEQYYDDALDKQSIFISNFKKSVSR
jgi:hypothetical protein